MVNHFKMCQIFFKMYLFLCQHFDANPLLLFIRLNWLARAIITAQKLSFPVRISSVNMTKFAGNYGFGQIY